MIRHCSTGQKEREREGVIAIALTTAEATTGEQ